MKEFQTTDGETVTIQTVPEGAILFAGLTVGIPGQVVLRPKDLAEIGYEMIAIAAEAENGFAVVSMHAADPFLQLRMDNARRAYEGKGPREIELEVNVFGSAHGLDGKIVEVEPLADPTDIDLQDERILEIADALDTFEPITLEDDRQIVKIAMSVDVRNLVAGSLRAIVSTLKEADDAHQAIVGSTAETTANGEETDQAFGELAKTLEENGGGASPTSSSEVPPPSDQSAATSEATGDAPPAPDAEIPPPSEQSAATSPDPKPKGKPGRKPKASS